MMMINNPLGLIVNALNSGGNPMAMIQQMAGSDPRISQALSMIRGKSPQQLQQTAMNMAKERGTTIDAIANEIGIRIPR